MRIIFFGTPDFALPSLKALVNSGEQVVAVFGDIALKLMPEAVLALADGDLACDPQAAAKPCVAKLREPGLSAVLTRLLGR